MGLKEKISIDSCQFDFRVLIYTTTTKVESLKKKLLVLINQSSNCLARLKIKSEQSKNPILGMKPIFQESKTIEFK